MKMNKSQQLIIKSLKMLCQDSSMKGFHTDDVEKQKTKP